MENKKIKYIQNESGEILNEKEMGKYIAEEAIRQYEECTKKSFADLPTKDQADCVLEQFTWQLEARGWSVITE
jgi:hypothetical protein